MKPVRARNLGRWAKVGLVVGALVALQLAFLLLPLDHAARWLIHWARRAGPGGMVAFALAYLGCVLLMVPGSLLTLAAGFAYGPLVGAALVLPPSVAGAFISFALTRTLARPWVARRLARHRRLQALDRAVGERGLTFMLLVRLSPIVPFNLLNYALAATRVRFAPYAVASVLGTIPGTVMFVYLGSALTSLAHLRGGGRDTGQAARSTFYWAGLAVTVVAAFVGTRLARSALRAATPPARAAVVPRAQRQTGPDGGGAMAASDHGGP